MSSTSEFTETSEPRHPHFTGWTTIEGYCWPLGYQPGEPVPVRCSSQSRTFTAIVSRVGGARTEVWRASGLTAPDHQSRHLEQKDEAWARDCQWPVSFVVPSDASWPSGFYHIALISEADHSESNGAAQRADAFFVLRSATVSTNPLLILSTNTYNAYNQWGGRCLYSGATRLSFARPLERGYLERPAMPSGFDGRVANVAAPSDPEHRQLLDYQRQGSWPLWTASAGWFNWERRFVAWAEQRGYQIDVAINADLEFAPNVVDGRRLLVSVGHDEYWSWAMRDTVDSFVDNGGNWAIFSGNTCFWQVRFEDDGRSMVCFKATARVADPVVGGPNNHTMTGIWSDPKIARPETESTGLTFTRGGYYRMGQAMADGPGTYTVHQPDHWAFVGTGLSAGDELGGDSFIVAYEVDGCELQWSDGRPRPSGADGAPTNMEVLATATARLVSITDTHCEAPEALWASVEPPGDLEATAETLFGDAGPENVNRLAKGHAVMAVFGRGKGQVFNAGTTDWAYGLGHDEAVTTITDNVLQMLGSG